MSSLWFNLAAIGAGIALLVWGADRFVLGAAALARNLGVSSLVIGLTVVGFGTSAPEMLVSALAALDGNPGVAVGNAIGSNIANIGLILGATALVVPLRVHSGALRREYPLLLGVSLLVPVLAWNLRLDRIDGVILLVLLVGITLLMIHWARHGDSQDPLATETAAEIPEGLDTPRSLLWLALGLVVLLIASRALVWGAVGLAQAFGVSDLVIGLTIVAIGTSLPELAASIAGVLKGEDDIAMGNVLGSNLYNLLAVLSIPALIAPTDLDPEVLRRDLPVMLLMTLAIYFCGRGLHGRQGRIQRWEGALLLIAFAAYQYWLYSETG